MAAAYVLADAAAKELAPGDPRLREGIRDALSGVHDREEQLSRIDELSRPSRSQKGSTGQLSEAGSRRSATAAARAAVGPPKSSGGLMPKPPMQEPFFVWSPLQGKHYFVRGPQDLTGPGPPPSPPAQVSPLAAVRSASLPALGGPPEEQGGSGQKRERKKIKTNYAAHLHRMPINQGAPAQLSSTYTATCQVPVSKAVDPKWSTELKRLDRNNAERIQYDNRLSAATMGSISPEIKYLTKTVF